MLLRVSQPCRSTSAHVGPKGVRSFPVLGARPLTGTAASRPAASAAPAGSRNPPRIHQNAGTQPSNCSVCGCPAPRTNRPAAPARRHRQGIWQAAGCSGCRASGCAIARMLSVQWAPPLGWQSWKPVSAAAAAAAGPSGIAPLPAPLSQARSPPSAPPFKAQVGLGEPRGIHQDAAAHGHRRSLAHASHVHAVLDCPCCRS